MKTPLGTEVDLDPGHIVLDGVAALRESGTAALLFSANLKFALRPHHVCRYGRHPIYDG